MERYDAEKAGKPEELADRAREAFAAATQHMEHGLDHGPKSSVREARYKGHRIRIETTYQITVDGQPVTGHVMVNNEGRVHYHSIPNQEFPSAVDMVKRIIDLLPPESPVGQRPDHQDHGPHH
jgi:hypothetical protein